MRYEIVEELQDGRSYAVITRDDDSTFGQIVDLRGCANDAEVDARVGAAADGAENVRQMLENLKAARVDRRGTNRPLPTRLQ